MSVNPAQVSKPVEGWEVDDEIDLRKYLDILIKRWREILFFTFLVSAVSALGVFAYRLLQVPIYEAQASVAIVRTQTEVNFDERFTTSSGQPPGNDITSRRSALLGLVYSGSIAERVVADLNGQLSEQERDPAYLLRQVKAELATQSRTGQSDLIWISVRAESPIRAAAIANAWAQYYVQEVNRIYGQVPNEMIASVQNELDQAQANYTEAQRALEQFLAESPLNTLRREMQETQLAIEAFDTQRQRDVRLLRLYYDQWLQTTAALSTARSLQTGLQQGGEGAVDSVAAALQLLKVQLVSATIGDVSSMQRINPDLTALSVSLSGSMQRNNPDLTAPSVSPSETVSRQPLLQLMLNPPSDVTLAGLNADLEGTIQALEQQLTRLETEIDALNQRLLSGERFNHLDAQIPDESELVNAIRARYPAIFERGVFSEVGEEASRDATLGSDGRARTEELLRLAGAETASLAMRPDAPMQESIALLEGRLQQLQAQVEAEQAAYQQFVQRRDLAWDALKALNTKQAELRLERAAANTEVRMGAPAVPPDKPVQSISVSVSIALAVMVGFMLALFLAFLFEYLGRPPLFVPVSQAT